jgi:hypothetical protein
MRQIAGKLLSNWLKSPLVNFKTLSADYLGLAVLQGTFSRQV